jgi:hypothetical protein
MMKVRANSKVMVTAVLPDQPLAYTRWPVFVSASVHTTDWVTVANCDCGVEEESVFST